MTDLQATTCSGLPGRRGIGTGRAGACAVAGFRYDAIKLVQGGAEIPCGGTAVVAQAK